MNSDLVPNATTDQKNKLDVLEEQTNKLSIVLKKHQVNQLNESSSNPNDVNKKSRQNKTKCWSYCRKNCHKSIYSRHEASGNGTKSQQTRAVPERRAFSIHGYNKRNRSNFGSRHTQCQKQQTRCGNQNGGISSNQTAPISVEIKSQTNTTNQRNQTTLNSWTHGRNNRQQKSVYFQRMTVKLW